MPITVHYKPEINLIICVHTGKVPDDEFLSSYISMYESESFSKGMDQLIDLRNTDSANRSKDVLDQFAVFVESKFKNSTKSPKVAVVAPNNLSFGIARMYEAYSVSIPWDFVVFRALDAAIAWLGASEDLMNELDKKAQQKN